MVDKYCLNGSPELIYQSKDLYFIIPDQEEQKEGDVEAQAKNVDIKEAQIEENDLVN